MLITDKKGALLRYASSLDWSTGVTKHEQTYRLLLRAAYLGLHPTEAIQLAEQVVAHYGGVIVQRDIEHQGSNAYAYVSGVPKARRKQPWGKRSFKPKPPPVQFEPDRLQSYTADVPEVTLECIKSLSPTWAEGPMRFLDALYGREERVFITDRMQSYRPLFWWRYGCPERQGLASAAGIYFLNNPVSGREEKATQCKHGRSYRAEQCVTAWRYLVVESDIKGYEAEWLKFLVKVPLPIVSIVTSGGKSVHALIRLEAPNKERWDKLKNKLKPFLVRHGADIQALSGVRMTRLPYGVRQEHGRRQELIYLNPDASAKAILER